MENYLGEKIVEAKDTPFAEYTCIDWAMYFIEHFGQFDGGHHKQWVLDQIARILKGTPVIISLASWGSGYNEYRCMTGDPSKEYLAWVEEMCDDNNYDYDEGSAP